MTKKKKKFNPYGSIVNHIRKLWTWDTERKAAIDRSKVFVPTYKKDGSLGKRKQCIGYKCEMCGKVLEKTGDIQVHHLDPVGNINDMTIANIIKVMFCPANRLQVLCKECHLDVHPERKKKCKKKK